MLQAETISQAAQRLHQAERSGRQLPQFSQEYPQLDVDDAYAIQRAWVDIKLADGRRVIGHKIGLTSRAMQISSHIDEPDHGILLDDMLYSEGGDIAVSGFIVPRLEVELAFVLDRPLRGPGITLTEVLDATRWVMPALEIIDARIQRLDPANGETRKVTDTISDNAANAGLVLGGLPVRPDTTDLLRVMAVLWRNGIIEESGVSAAVLNHPAHGVAWLANKLARHGVELQAGQTILAGSFTRPVDIRAGDTFHVDYDRLGSIACRFV